MTTLASPDTISIADQIACVKREMAMRERVYPRWVTAGKIKQEKADLQISEMKAVLKTLQDVERLRKIEVAARALTLACEQSNIDGAWVCLVPPDEWRALNGALGQDVPQQQWDDLRDALDPDEPEA